MLGADATTLNFQVGANTTTDDTVSIKTTNMTKDTTMTAVTSTSSAVIDSSATSGAIGTVIDNIDKAIDDVNDTRATFGATQSRFDSIISNLQSGVENQSAARSRIMDADFASETANMSRANVLQQAGTAMIAQANQQPPAGSVAAALSAASPAGARPLPRPEKAPPGASRRGFCLCRARPSPGTGGRRTSRPAPRGTPATWAVTDLRPHIGDLAGLKYSHNPIQRLPQSKKGEADADSEAPATEAPEVATSG